MSDARPAGSEGLGLPATEEAWVRSPGRRPGLQRGPKSKPRSGDRVTEQPSSAANEASSVALWCASTTHCRAPETPETALAGRERGSLAFKVRMSTTVTGTQDPTPARHPFGRVFTLTGD